MPVFPEESGPSRGKSISSKSRLRKTRDSGRQPGPILRASVASRSRGVTTYLGRPGWTSKSVATSRNQDRPGRSGIPTVGLGLEKKSQRRLVDMRTQHRPAAAIGLCPPTKIPVPGGRERRRALRRLRGGMLPAANIRGPDRSSPRASPSLAGVVAPGRTKKTIMITTTLPSGWRRIAGGASRRGDNSKKRV